MTAAPAAARTPAPEDHDHHDGCLCGQAIAEHEATPDHALPAAEGGVAEAPKRKGRRPTRTAVEGEA